MKHSTAKEKKKQNEQILENEHLLNGKVIVSNILLYKKKIGSIIHIMIDMIIIIIIDYYYHGLFIFREGFTNLDLKNKYRNHIKMTKQNRMKEMEVEER